MQLASIGSFIKDVQYTIESHVNRDKDVYTCVHSAQTVHGRRLDAWCQLRTAHQTTCVFTKHQGSSEKGVISHLGHASVR